MAWTWVTPRAPLEMQVAWRELGDLCGKRILLLGNGDSEAEVYMLTQNPETLIFSDLSPAGVRRIRDRYGIAADGNTAHFAAIDALDLPLHDGSVDLLYGFAFVHHLPDLGRFLTEAARVLRPGGRCVFMDNAYSPLWQFLKLWGLRPLMNLSHRRAPRSPEDVEDTMKGGFSVDHLAAQIRAVGGEPWFHRQSLLYYLWRRASVSLFPEELRRVQGEEIAAMLARVDERLSRFRLVRNNLIRLVWGFDKPRVAGRIQSGASA